MLRLAPPQNGSSVRAPTYSTFDQLGRTQHVVDAFQKQTYMGYDATGNLVVSVDRRGVASYFSYDALNRQTSAIDPGKARSVTVFDEVGNRTAMHVEQGFSRQPFSFSPFSGERVSSYFTFDALNRPQTATSPQSRYSQTIALTYWGYDPASNRIFQQVENPRSGADIRCSYFNYDVLNRVVGAFDPPASSTVGAGFSYFEFDAAGNRVRAVDQEGRGRYFAFDDVHRNFSVTNGLGNAWVTYFDLRNSVTHKIDPENRWAYMTYDALGRLQTQANMLGNTSYFGYDAWSSKVVSVNPRGCATYFGFDLLARLATRQDALGGVRYWGYDEVGNKVLQLDELGNPTYWAYDQASRVRSVRDALQNQTYFWHDAVGQVRVKIDAEGRTTYFGYYGYDAARRPTRMSFSSDPWIYYVYDSVGNLVQTTDETGTFGNVYDSQDRLVTKKTIAGVVYYAYDKASLKAKVIGPDRGAVYHYYDAAARLERIEVAEPSPFSLVPVPVYFLHDQSGMRTCKIGAGVFVLSVATLAEGGLSAIAEGSIEESLGRCPRPRDFEGIARVCR